MLEHFFSCPYCGAEISMILETVVRSQTYIEDCEVCCNPIEISFTIEQGDLTEFQAISIEQ
jgi:transcription elongation factor Elf1